MEHPIELVDRIAEQLYEHCLARQRSNLTKDGQPGNPRKVGEAWADIRFDEPKHHYRNVARWMLDHAEEIDKALDEHPMFNPEVDLVEYAKKNGVSIES